VDQPANHRFIIDNQNRLCGQAIASLLPYLSTALCKISTISRTGRLHFRRFLVSQVPVPRSLQPCPGSCMLIHNFLGVKYQERITVHRSLLAILFFALLARARRHLAGIHQ
jgi:hypothetical protein